MAFQNDGSYTFEHFQSRPLTLNENDAPAKSVYLHDGDETTIAAFMDKIYRLAHDRGRKLVFVIPPVYETERHSGADAIVSRAIGLVPHIPVIDDRATVRDAKYFLNYDHPNPLYFDRLVAVLRERGLLAAR